MINKFIIKFIFCVFIFLVFKNDLIYCTNENLVKCYKCGTDNQNCTKNVKSVEEKCESESNNCFTKFDETGRNIRGCLAKNEKCIENCISCNSTECNNIKYPEIRRECFICKSNGIDCKRAATNYKILPCNHINDTCFTYFDSFDTVRGCTSDKQYEICLKNPEYCMKCEGDKCNKEKVKDLKCFKCDNEMDCKRPDPIPNKNCEINIKDEEICVVDKENDMNLCYIERKSNNIVSRGCANAKHNEKTDEINYCKGGNCNKMCVEDIQCSICQEHDDKNCSKNDIQNSLSDKKCEPYTTVCHICLSLDESVFQGCGKPSNNLKCNYCYKNNCNAPAPKIERSCYNCSKTDPKCSHLQAGNLTVTCPDNITECITKLNGDNYIERRCAIKDENCLNNSDDKCKICNKNNCNSDIIPTKRRICYQCDAKSSENCTYPSSKNSKLKAYPCHKYDENDKCYTTFKDIDTMIRGCSSDSITDSNRYQCEKNPEHCIFCDHNECNNVPFMTTKLLCIQCNNKDANCAYEYNAKLAKSCQPLHFWKNETCFTNVESISDVTRGCTQDNNKNFDCINDKNDKCKKCSKNGCNNENIFKQTCYKCRSDLLSECSYSKLRNIKPSNCSSPVSDIKNKGCFIEKYYNRVVFRGCIVDLNLETQTKCMDSNYKDCTYCDGVNCNDGKVPDGSSLVNTVSFVALLILLVVYLIT